MAKKHSFAKGVATGVLGTAATVAGPEPEIAAKNIHTTTVTIARPPVYLPKKALAVFMRRLDIPPPPIISPARTKNGIDIVVKESALVTRFCTIYPDVKSPETKMVIKEAIPKDIDTGTFRIKSTTSEPNNTRLIIHFHPLFIIFNSQYNCLNTSDC